MTKPQKLAQSLPSPVAQPARHDRRTARASQVACTLILAVFLSPTEAAAQVSSTSQQTANSAPQSITPKQQETEAKTEEKPSAPQPPREPALLPVEDQPGLPRVLLLGDSISIGYTLPVRDALSGVANVHRPPTNCASTKHGLVGIDEWLGDKPWDVIHFNFGLHDLKYVVPGSETLIPVDTEGAQHQISIEQYRENLIAIVERLKQTDAKLILCLTTPVPEGASGRRPEDVERYNQVALDVAHAHGILVNDLNAFALERLESIQRPRNVHFTDEGSAVLASHVVEVIREALNKSQ